MRCLGLVLLLCAAVSAVSAARPQPSDDCTYRVNLQRGWYTTHPGNMRPLQCPAGFRTAAAVDVELLEAFLVKEFETKAWPKLEDSARWGCPAGIRSQRFRAVNGCIQTWPKGVAPTVMAQGKLTYVCRGDRRQKTLGLDGEGTFKKICV